MQLQNIRELQNINEPGVDKVPFADEFDLTENRCL
jgi:hypothetical protein